MDNRLQKNISKWEEENRLLELVKDNLENYIALKDEKGDKDEMDIANAKITGIIEENSWMKLDWKLIKRSKASRAEGLAKVERKISARTKKIKEGELLISTEDNAVATEVKDWESVIQACDVGSQYYHWAYGRMEVVAMEDVYIYLKLLDKKGIRSSWIGKNNVLVEVDGKIDEMKEFSKYAIGRWLFPEEAEVEVKDSEAAHKMFQN